MSQAKQGHKASPNDPPPEKLRPSAPEIEERLLGSVMQSAEALRDTVDLLAPDDFRRISHQPIWRTIQALHRAGAAVDIETVIDELRRRDELEAVGGASEISRLTTVAEHPENAKTYARTIERIAVVNRMIDAALKIHEEAWKEPTDIDGLIDFSVNLIQGARGEARGDNGPYRLESVADVLNQPAPDPLIEGLYSLNSTGVLSAPGGSGKSALKLDQLAHIALGRTWEGHAVTGGHAVYVCAEGAAFLPERLAALLKKLKVSELHRLHIVQAAPQLMQPSVVSGLIRSITHQLPEMPVAVVIDTISQTAGGATEDDNSEMARYMAALDRIRAATGAYVEAIHHTGKAEERGARGASAIEDNCDTATRISVNGDIRVMRCHKQRGGGGHFKPFSYKVAAQTLDDGTGRTGPIIEACDPPAPRAPSIPPNYLVMLSRLRDVEDGLTHAEWLRRCTGITESTFGRGRKYLVDEYHLATHDEETGRYAITEAGLGVLPRNPRGGIAEVPRSA